jgi:hypothetical protein
MKRAFLAIAAVISCADITAAEGSPIKVVLTPRAASAACVIPNPDPASVKAKQGIAFINNSTVHLTLVLIEDGEDLPLVSVAPGDTSGAVRFNSEGIRQYYSLGCGSALSERHTLAVTVN